MEKNDRIRRYFQSWLDQNREGYDEIFKEFESKAEHCCPYGR